MKLTEIYKLQDKVNRAQEKREQYFKRMYGLTFVGMYKYEIYITYKGNKYMVSDKGKLDIETCASIDLTEMSIEEATKHMQEAKDNIDHVERVGLIWRKEMGYVKPSD